MTYKVDRTPAVNHQLRDLADRAKAQRIHQAYLDALREMLSELQTRPLEWGDPQYKTKHAGGIVCHATPWPILVRYAVYQNEKIVMIIQIRPRADSPLADS
jgi:mRNA-degrading endonuclease RelE of RelBE toxin-antitoxin system